jgi:hypothetical protein
MMKERRAAGATHSFRLTPRAAELMDEHPAIRPNSKLNGKSAWASKAIQWFFDSPILGREYDDEGEFTGYFVKKTHGSPAPIDLMIENDDLRRKLSKAVNELVEWKKKHRSWIKWISGILRRRKWRK